MAVYIFITDIYDGKNIYLGGSMDFKLTDEQQLLKNTVREFMDREIAPVASEYDRKYHPLPQEIFKEFLQRLKPFGFLGGSSQFGNGG